ncbi:hypothetical protein [Gorillibacterium massiliense]|uniref:hypothetical protein n=1 Tax=Gorillibacterium massiliense TaxID=1280390 RepID=UPI0004B7CA11|nr:hypothetical protein [Gorillibacterium massiliense]
MLNLNKHNGAFEIRESCVGMRNELDRISNRLEELQKALLLLEFLQHGGGVLNDQLDDAHLDTQESVPTGTVPS